MCRWDDGDYEWYVGGMVTEPADQDRPCEDCGRTVAAGTPIVRIMPEPNEEHDERPHVIVAYAPRTWVTSIGPTLKRWFSDGDPFVCVVDENHFSTVKEFDDAVAAFDALGFLTDEVRDPRLPVTVEPDHYWCPQCKAANYWLEQVCDQSVVLVASGDIIDHAGDYTPAELGPDFMTLAALARQRWRTKDYGTLIGADVIDRLAHSAVHYAATTGLHPD